MCTYILYTIHTVYHTYCILYILACMLSLITAAVAPPSRPPGHDTYTHLCTCASGRGLFELWAIEVVFHVQLPNVIKFYCQWSRTCDAVVSLPPSSFLPPFSLSLSLSLSLPQAVLTIPFSPSLPHHPSLPISLSPSLSPDPSLSISLSPSQSLGVLCNRHKDEMYHSSRGVINLVTCWTVLSAK